MRNRIKISILTGIIAVISIFWFFESLSKKTINEPSIIIKDADRDTLINLLAEDKTVFYENSCRQIDKENYTIRYSLGEEDCGIWNDKMQLRKVINPGFEIKLLNSGKNKITLSFDGDKVFPKLSYQKNNYQAFTEKFIRNEYDYIEFLSHTKSVEVNFLKLKDHNEIVKVSDSLGYSQIAFNTPSQMILEEENPITLLVANFLTQEELAIQLDSILGKSNLDSLETHRIKSTAFLEAHLTGQNFSVISGSPIRQPIFDYDVTKWEWIVEPKTIGIKYLVLTINIILDVKGKESPYTIQTFKKEINVKVKNKVWHFYKNNESLILAIFGIIFSFLAVYFGFWLGKKAKQIDEKKINKTKLKKERKAKEGKNEDGI